MQITKQDKFSKFLCTDCAYKIARAYSFMSQCRDNQALLYSKSFNENLLLESEDHPQTAAEGITAPESVKAGPGDSNNNNIPVDSADGTVSEGSEPISLSLSLPEDEDIDDWIKTHDDARGDEEMDDDDQIPVSSIVECELNEDQSNNGIPTTLEQDSNLRDVVGLPDEVGVNVENPYKCSVCYRAFGKKANVLSHFQTQHTNLEVPSCWKYEVEKVKCNLCNLYVENMFAHIEHHNGKRTFKCNVCEWAFYTKNYLSIHFSKLHKIDNAIDSKPDKFQCKLCMTVVCQDYADLINHYRKYHLNEMKSKIEGCPICGRETRYLKVHMMKHHNHNYPFKCQLCDKSYTKERFLLVHMTAAHTAGAGQNLPVQCVKCHMQFNNKRLLKLHIKRYHANANIMGSQLPLPLQQQIPQIPTKNTNTKNSNSFNPTQDSKAMARNDVGLNYDQIFYQFE